MRILHVFGNWKWTGPAEPAINLAWEQRKRHDVLVAVGPCRFADLTNLVADEARKRGLEVAEGAALQKHLNPFKVWRAMRWLIALVAARRIETVHVHLDADHAVAAAARARIPFTLVRTYYDRLPPRYSPRVTHQLRRTDGLLAISTRALDDLREQRPAFADRIALQPGAIDLDRFLVLGRPKSELRAKLGLPERAVLGGIVARVQRHRRYEVLLEALATAARTVPDLHLVILGRGTFAEAIAGATARRLGVSERVHRPGYLEGAAYVEALNALDFAIFLVPGTDGSCRAVREELACGLPVIAAPVDPLPELVGDGVRGLIAAVQPEPLANALVRMAGDAVLRERLAAQARGHARLHFSLVAQAAAVDALYQSARHHREVAR